MNYINIDTWNKTQWVNTKEFIVLHHTWDYTIKSVINTFTNKNSKASAHYVIDIDWSVYKLWDDSDILWHAWVSTWKWKTDMNRYSIWIEVVWPNNKIFTHPQYVTLKELIKELSDKYNIPVGNIIRHKDIAPKRKTDLSDVFWNKYHHTYNDFIKSIFNIQEITGQYEKIFIEKYGESSIYKDIAWAIKQFPDNKELIYFILIWMERIVDKQNLT